MYLCRTLGFVALRINTPHDIIKPILTDGFFMRLKWIQNGQTPKYELLEPMIVAGHKIPAGFTSDGATVPKLARGFVAPMGPYAPAAFLHDFLLTKEPRKQARKEFIKALNELGISGWRKPVIISSVAVYDAWRSL